MEKNSPIAENILAVLESLPADLQLEIGHYADFVRTRYLQASQRGEDSRNWTAKEVTMASLPALWAIWDNDEDAIYDSL